jgi:hypothetical protein
MAKSKARSSAGDERTMSADLKAQHEYAERLQQSGFDFSMVVGDAFVRGMRDIGYKHTGTALDELIDNAIQAEAKNVHIVLGYGDKKKSKKKPDMIAVVDDGHGMERLMLWASVIWGGTHREADKGSRCGFGRYGYGLPSSCVSQGKRFQVYSRVDGGVFHRTEIDVDDISDGKYTNQNGRICVAEPAESSLPKWISAYVKNNFPDGSLKHGTVVVIDKLDGLSYKTTNQLQRFLLEHFGVVYRNFLRQVNVLVDGQKVEPVDPLFITPGFRHYDLDEDRAEALEPLAFDVKDVETRKALGTVKVRFSYMPPGFQRVPEDKLKQKGGKRNARFGIMDEHNGIIIMRSGRQIDVVTSRCPWTTFINYDRNWGVEVDFPPTLDEEFSITTSKQQVVLRPRMWDLLKEAGVWKAIKELRARFKKDLAVLKSQREAQEEDAKRASEEAMEAAQKFKTKKSAEPSAEEAEEARENLEQEARKRARQTGRKVEDVERELEQEIQGRPFKVSQESMPGAPFYRVQQLGGQKVLHLNQAHRFYTDVYVGPESTPRLRAALEALLFVIGDCELDASDDRRLFYESERAEWSKRLSVVLDRLDQIENIEDSESATAVEDEDAVAEAAESEAKDEAASD